VVSQVLGGLGQKLTRTDICKKISTQSDPNPWWAGLAHGFWPTLTALHVGLDARLSQPPTNPPSA